MPIFNCGNAPVRVWNTEFNLFEVGFEHLYCPQCEINIYKCPICSCQLYVFSAHKCSSRQVDNTLAKWAMSKKISPLSCAIVRPNCCEKHTCDHKDLEKYKLNRK